MSTLHRAQVYLEEEQLRRLKIEAEREHLPVAVLVRGAISRFLKAKDKGINWDNDPLVKAVGKVKLSVTNASINHDHYLYGRKKHPPKRMPD